MDRRKNLKIWWVISVALASVLSGSVWATGTFAGGDGSKANPFQINTPAQMNEVCQYLSSYFTLTADIDLSGYTGTAFNIIGSTVAQFTGFFDGSGYTINNFTYTSTQTDYIALFGYVGTGVQIKNLGLINVNVDAGTSNYVGGLVGWNYGTVSNCYATGTVNGNVYVGGLVGVNYDSDIFASFWDTETTGQPNGVGYNSGSGTVEVYGRTTAQMQMESTFTDYGWDFVGETTNGTEDFWKMIHDGEDYPRLSWQVEYPGDIAGLYGVDLVDFAVFSLAWLSDDTPTSNWNPACDISEPHDGIIDELDLAVFTGNWLLGK